MCKDFFELEIFEIFEILKIQKFGNSEKFRRKKSSKIWKFPRFFLDQNIFKNISQIQLNENGLKVGPAPRVILVILD